MRYVVGDCTQSHAQKVCYTKSKEKSDRIDMDRMTKITVVPNHSGDERKEKMRAESVGAVGVLLLIALVLLGCPDDPRNSPPTPPNNFIVKNRNGQITLNWRAVAGATEYRIYREGTRIAADISITDTTYIDDAYAITDPTNSSRYRYTVRAVNSVGESGDSALVSIIPPLTVRGLTAGATHSCALLDNGGIKCWGDGSSGRLGQGNTNNIGDGGTSDGVAHLSVSAVPMIDLGRGRTATQISARASHTCALLDNGRIKCWGDGRFGALGQGGRDNIGDEPNELGDALMSIDLGTNDGGAPLTATQISAGGLHTCALLNNGSVKCWGADGDGQLGQGSVANLTAPPASAINLGMNNDGTPLTAMRISAGASNTCALLTGGNIKCWGDGSNGQLGSGNENNIGDGGVTGTTAHLTIAAAPVINLGVGRTAIQISAGLSSGTNNHTCALLDNNGIKCWGLGGNGQLGQGSGGEGGIGGSGANEIALIATIDLGRGRTTQQVHAGATHTCALSDHSGVKCWGDGKDGRLGQGSTDNIGDEQGELGYNLPFINFGLR